MEPKTTALAAPVQTLPMAFEPQNLDQALVLADKLAKSNLLPKSLRANPPDVLVVLMTGREMGLSPMQAIRGINVIEGRAAVSAELMVAQCLRRPECEHFTLVESTPQRAVYETKRRGARAVRLEFTMAQATAAGIAGKDNWRKWPAAMLRARCASSLARAVHPDLVLGLLCDDEGEELLAQVREVPASAAAPIPSPAGPRVEQSEISDAEVVEPVEPANDALNGEVRPEPVEDLVGGIRSKIAAAKSLFELRAIVPMIQVLAHEVQAAVRPDYSARATALKAEAAAATVATKVDAPGAARQPGEDG